MTAIKRNMYIEQGTSFDFPFRWCNPGDPDPSTPGTPKDLTGWTFRSQMRKNQQAPTQVDASTANGKIIAGIDPDDPTTDPQLGGTADPTNGWIMLRLNDADTDGISSKTSMYDLEAESPEGKVYRLLQGSVSVDPNVTQKPEDPVEA